VKDAGGSTWTYSHDLRGRQIKVQDPDQGVTVTTYDAADQVATVRDARGTTLAYEYDALGRKTAVHRDSTDGPVLTSWLYDTLAKGQLTSSTRKIGTDEYVSVVAGYNDRYQPTGTRITIPAAEGALKGTYASDATYFADGSPKTTTMPAATGVSTGLPTEKLSYSYDTLGNPTLLLGVGSYVNGTDYDPYGSPLQLALANGGNKFSWQTFAYEEGTRRLARQKVTREGRADPDSDVRYAYDPAGNVTSVSDAPAGQPADTQCFRYDHQRRLTEAWTPAQGCATAPSVSGLGGPAPYWQSYTYDATGNRATRVEHAAAGDTTTAYSYPPTGQPRPHAVTGATITGPGTTRKIAYGYDDAGSLTTRRTGDAEPQEFTWDAEGHLASVADPGVTDPAETTRYVYDADGTRLLRRDATGVTLYLGNTELRYDKATAKVTGTRYYVHAGRTVAMRTTAGVTFLAADPHGTADTAVDSVTQAITRRRSDPFGNPRDPEVVPWRGERGFVGGTQDPSTGLTHLGAREYDPATGRFISVDPVIDLTDPQQIHPYAYARNSPVTYSDPTGLRLPDEDVAQCRRESPGADCTGGMNSHGGGVTGGGGSRGGRNTDPCAGNNSRYCSVLRYMTSEMKVNSGSRQVRTIRNWNQEASEWNRLNWFLKAVSRNSGPKAKQQALAQWGLLVCPRVCTWDHKPKLRDMYGLTLKDNDTLYMDVPGTDQRMYYDVWSNIHYGYVGREAGFAGQELQDGAKVPILAGTTTEADIMTVQIGIDLYENYTPEELTPGIVHNAILARQEALTTARPYGTFKPQK
jgi:RHS repeat-associated protein